jgi:hypothetical protein
MLRDSFQNPDRSLRLMAWVCGGLAMYFGAIFVMLLIELPKLI